MHVGPLCRYGENVVEANANPGWICPVCRDICNCIVCRRLKGQEPTGDIYKKVNLINPTYPKYHLLVNSQLWPKMVSISNIYAYIVSGVTSWVPVGGSLSHSHRKQEHADDKTSWRWPQIDKMIVVFWNQCWVFMIVVIWNQCFVSMDNILVLNGTIQWFCNILTC